VDWLEAFGPKQLRVIVKPFYFLRFISKSN
jgi:hypothetical protein